MYESKSSYWSRLPGGGGGGGGEGEGALGASGIGSNNSIFKCFLYLRYYLLYSWSTYTIPYTVCVVQYKDLVDTNRKIKRYEVTPKKDKIARAADSEKSNRSEPQIKIRV